MQMEIAGDIYPFINPLLCLYADQRPVLSVQRLNLCNDPKLMELMSLSCRDVLVQDPK